MLEKYKLLINQFIHIICYNSLTSSLTDSYFNQNSVLHASLLLGQWIYFKYSCMKQPIGNLQKTDSINCTGMLLM